MGKTTKYSIGYYMWKCLLIDYPHLGVFRLKFPRVPVTVATVLGDGGVC